MPTPPPGPVANTGSGKFGTPCERMQRAMARAAAFIFAVSAAEGVPPLGRYLRQVCIAAWNAGALTETPLTVIELPEPARWPAWIRMPPWPLFPGSGKLGTPCERMHSANAIPLFCLVALVPGSLPEEEPPQAAARIAVTTKSGTIDTYRGMAE